MSFSRLDIELLLLGELPAERRLELTAAMDLDADLKAQVDRVAAEVAAVDVPPLRLTPANLAAQHVIEPVVAPAPANRQWAWLVGGVALAAALALTVFALSDTPPGMTYRGAMELDVQIVRQGTVSDAGSIVTTRAGDLLQWRVVSDSDGYLTVIDLQDDGAMSVWKQTDLTAGRSVDGTVLLDGYAGAERVWFVITDGALDPASVALPRGSALIEADSLPVDGVQRSLLLTGAQ